jgi:membrane protease YdiL (CAAX protease family)
MGVWPAAAISAVVFAIPHISSADLTIVPPLAIFGMLLAWLYEYTGSLGPPIALHMINNAIAFAVITSGG